MALKPVIAGMFYRSESGALKPLIAGMAYQNGPLRPLIAGGFVSTGGGGGSPPTNDTPPSISGGVAQVTEFDFTGLNGADFATGTTGLRVSPSNTGIDYYAWFNTGTENSSGGFPVEVAIDVADNAATIATKFAAALTAFLSGTQWSGSAVGAVATITNITLGTADEAADIDAGVAVTTTVQGGFPVGTTFTRVAGVWTGADTVAGAWQHDQGIGSWQNIPDETGVTYTLGAYYVGEMIRYREAAVNAGGTSYAASNELGPMADGLVDIQYPAGDEFVDSGSSDYLRLFLEGGSESHVFWGQAGTSVEPTGLTGTITYHEIEVDGLEADEVRDLFCQAIVNTGEWTIPGFTQQTAPVNTVPPVIDNESPYAGQTITCSTGTWTESPTSYTYQWKADTVNIGGATSNTYEVEEAVDVELTCEVTAHNAIGASSPELTSNAATVIEEPADPPVAGFTIWSAARRIVGLNNDDPISPWPNEGSGADLTQATGGLRPLYKNTGGPNGLPFARFSTSRIGNADAISQPCTIFAVVKVFTPGGNANFIGDNSGGGDACCFINTSGGLGLYGGNVVEQASGAAGWAIFCGVLNGASSEIFRDGASVASGSIGFGDLSSGILLGAYDTTGTGSFDGDLAEVIVYPSVLSAPNIAAVEAYLDDIYFP